MKNMWKYAMLLVAASGFFACEDPEVGETLPDYYSKTFVTIQTSGSTDLIEGEIENTPVGVVPKMQYNRQVVIGLTRELSKDLTIEIGADPSLLAARAEADGIEYKELPAAACVASAESIVIPAGERQVIVDLSFGDTSFASETQAIENYMLPLVITKVSDPSVTISKQLPAVYCKVTASYSVLRKIDSPSDIIGASEDPTGWTQKGGDNRIIDGDLSTSWSMPQQRGNVVTIDMGEVKHVTGLAAKGYSYAQLLLGIEYSVDGENYLSAGTLDEATGYMASGWSYGAFYGSVDARYLRLNISSSSSYSYYRTVYEILVYAAEFTEPYAFLSTTESGNTIKASVIHMPSGSNATVSGTVTAHVSEPSAAGYSVNYTVDNSLIDAYNAANGTTCKALPDGFLNIPECKIDAMSYGSNEIKPELTGDLSSLTEPVYLVPLRISIDGLKTSQKNGVAYMIITTEYNDFMTGPTSDDVRGNYVEDRSAFKASDADTGAALGSSLFDGSEYSSSESRNIKVDLGASYKVSALRLNYSYASYGSYYRPVKLRISTSDDGTNWTIRGTLTENFWQRTGSDFLMVLSQSVECHYVKVELLQYGSSYYYGMGEFGIYAE